MPGVMVLRSSNPGLSSPWFIEPGGGDSDEEEEAAAECCFAPNAEPPYETTVAFLVFLALFLGSANTPGYGAQLVAVSSCSMLTTLLMLRPGELLHEVRKSDRKKKTGTLHGPNYCLENSMIESIGLWPAMRGRLFREVFPLWSRHERE